MNTHSHGFITKEEFLHCTAQFLDISETLQDGWQELQVAESIIIQKKIPLNLHLSLPSTESGLNDTGDDHFKDSEATCEDEDDSLSTVETQDTSMTACLMDYHIVYSHSYCVPVLYFNAYKSDGSLLSIDEIWSTIPQHYTSQLDNKWAFLTQQEHPLLRRSFYMLHPCHTATLMANVQIHNSKHNYLISWLSLVGPVVHLHLPVQYATLHRDTAHACTTPTDHVMCENAPCVMNGQTKLS